MEIVVGWFIFSVVAAMIASSKGRSGFGYFLLSLVLSPLIGLILAVGMSSVDKGPRVAPDTHIRCPDCKEFILRDAKRCKHCGCALVPESEMNEAQLLKHYGITQDEKGYLVRSRHHETAASAIDHARRGGWL